MKMVPGPPAATAAVVTSSSSSHQQFQVTEDTPVDYLEGCMEILVVFPNEKSIPMSIQRRMPMLDLLIHVTAANKISPSGHVLQVTDGDGRLLSHKPSTPIGSLNAHTVYIVAKNRLQGSGVGDRSTSRANNNGGGGGGAHQQFQPSFRLQVRLPRNQLFVTRVTGRTLLADLLRTVCEEKDLDPRLYELRHPVNLDERLRLSSCIDDYKLQEVVVVLASTGGGGGLQQQQSVHDLPPTVNSKKSLVTVTSSSNTMNINSSKSGLRSNHSSDSTLNHGSVGGEKKKRGLFGLFGFGRNNKKGSSMGDSSISSDSAGDRSISPTRSDEPQPPVAEPVTVRQPSPVLVSKRLAEEAVAKRNSRLSQLTAAENVSSPATPIINGSAKGPAPRAGPKKRMAPAPPPSTLAINDRNSGNSKAPSEVSTASSSNSPAVLVRKKPDQSTSHRTPSPIQTEPIQRRPMNQAKSAEPAESSPTRTQSASNLLSSSPNLSSSNLTTVSSTSNASLASAVKKRKAPVPPQPVVVEQAESMTTISAVVATTTEATAAAATTTTNGHVRDDVEEDEDVKSEQQQEPQHDDMDDRMSAVSSSIASSEIGIGGVINRSVAGSESLSPSPPPLPAIEPPDEQTRVVVAPQPAARSSLPPRRPPLPSAEDLNNNSVVASAATPEDEENISLDMFTSKKEVHAQEVIAQQQKLQAKQLAEAERQRIARASKDHERDSVRKKVEDRLTKEKLALETLGLVKRQDAIDQVVDEPPKRRQWGLPPEMRLDLLPPDSESSSKNNSPAGTVTSKTIRTIRAHSPSVGSEASEYLSLSEEDATSSTPPSVPIRRMRTNAAGPKLNQHPPTPSPSLDGDADDAFRAMCITLAARQRQSLIELSGSPALPSDLSQVPVETLQSMDDSDTEETDSRRPSGGGAEFWRRSSSEPVGTAITLHQLHAAIGARRSSSFDAGQSASSHTPPLTNTAFMNDYQHVRQSSTNSNSHDSDYEDISVSMTDRATADRANHRPDVGGVRKERIAANNQNGSLDDDYEVLNYPKKINSTDPVAVVAAMNGARQREEMLASEPIYTMVIKTPPVSIRAVVQEKVEMDIVTTSSPMLSDEMDHEDEREVERDAGDGQTESPILWEYKLPAPPTPFQDSLISSVKSLPLVAETTVTESSGRSRMSSMSVDSLQDGGRSSDEDEDQSRSPLTPRTDSGVCVKVTLFSGSELLGESITDCLETSSTDEAVKEPPVVMVLKDAQLESTTDEPLSLNSSAPASLPPLPSTSPPSYSDEEENEADSDSMRFSISTYRRRAEEDSHYDHKMATNSNSNAEKDPVAEVKVPASSETKEPETTVDGTASTAVEIRGSGNGESATTTAAATPALLVPVMNLDLIQQFQAALHTIADPQARALQEEFLRLQQQFLTLQLQATAHQQQTQQNNSQVPVQQQQTNESGDQEETGSAPSSLIVQEVKHERSESVDNSPKNRIHRTEEETVTPVPDEVDEPVVYRYTGPPQVKMETWKPGRPRSEVMDYSRSSSFNVPLAKKEVVKKATPVPAPILTVEASSSITPQPPTPPPPPPTPPAIEAPLPVQEEVVLAPVIEEVVKSREEVTVEVVEGLSVREKVDQVESSNGNKPAVMRKSSFLTARPFEANRPVSMPIKRPNFTPMVIQPVPFVSRKIRAPEVRGFASLPYVDLESTSKTPRNSTPSPTTESTMLPSSSKGRWVAQASQENPTIVIRNKLIESARRPSAELNGSPLKTTEDSSNQVDAGSEDAKESRVDVETTRVKTTPSSGQPLAMPTSSSLLLAASANANATKRQTFSAAEAPSVDKMQVASSGAVNNSKANNDAPARRSLSSKFVRRVDPREELLNSIRDFANGGGLKKTGVNIN